MSQQNKWIPISEKLPKRLEPVLVTVKAEDGYHVFYDWVYDDEKWLHFRDVVAWMPLPELPEQYKNGGE